MKKLLPILAIVALTGCSKKKHTWECNYSRTTSSDNISRKVVYEDKTKNEIKEIERLNNFDTGGVKSTMSCKKKVF